VHVYKLIPTRFPGTRIVAAPAALDNARWPHSAIVMRTARDEAFVLAVVQPEAIDDPHAIVVADAGYAGSWLPAEFARAYLERNCEWEPPAARPAFAQGMIGGLASKLWLENDRVLILVPATVAEDFRDRLTEFAA
jgi:hypothetical protein